MMMPSRRANSWTVLGLFPMSPVIVVPSHSTLRAMTSEAVSGVSKRARTRSHAWCASCASPYAVVRDSLSSGWSSREMRSELQALSLRDRKAALCAQLGGGALEVTPLRSALVGAEEML